MAVNVRAPLLLTDAFAVAHDGKADALVINMIDAKLSAPNPDFLSYTLSKQALAGLTELSARALAPRGIRVNGIAPALMRVRPGRAREFCGEAEGESLRRAVEPGDCRRALRYLSASPVV